MTMAETATLAVQLNLTGNFTSGIAAAEGKLGAFNSAATNRVSAVSGAFSKLGNVASGVGGALSHAGGQIKSLISGPLGMIGLGAGLFTVGGALERAIARAQTFGDEVRQIAAVTGLGARQVSLMAGTFEHFGIGADTATRLIGFLEKNVGLLAAKKDGIAKFQKEFGFALKDASGHLKDANALLLTTVDYFNNKHIPATEKAAALSKLFGRSWQELIPYLKAGRQGIADVQAELAKYGLTLTDQNIKSLADFKASQRDLGTALGGLELQIGLRLVPTLSKFAQGLTTFIASNGPQITQFFDDLGKFAGNAAGTIAATAHTVSTFWNSIPQAFRDLLVKSVIADRTIKFLFGFDPLKAAGGPLAGLLSHIPGLGFLQRGSSPANPMWVASAQGGLGGAGGAGGGIGLGGILASGAALAAALVAVQKFVVEPRLQEQAGSNISNTQTLIGRGNAFEIGTALRGVRDSVSSLSGLQKILYDLNADGVKVHTESLERALEQALIVAGRKNADFSLARDRMESQRIVRAETRPFTVNLRVATNISVSDVNGALRTHATYNTGMTSGISGVGHGI